MALGENGTIYSRARSGETTTPTNPTAPAQLNGIAYGTAGWVAVGANGTSVAALDGITWTVEADAASPPTSTASPRAAWAGTSRPARAERSCWARSPPSGRAVTAPGTTNDLYAATYGNGTLRGRRRRGNHRHLHRRRSRGRSRPRARRTTCAASPSRRFTTTADGVATTTFQLRRGRQGRARSCTARTGSPGRCSRPSSGRTTSTP